MLFHVTADTRWSDLPLSGAFVDMLKRIVALAGSNVNAERLEAQAARETVPANRVLDGFGAFTPPPSTARPVAAGYSFRATADHPPGFYGPPEGLLAVNTLIPTDRLTPLDYAPLSARLEAYRLGEPKDLRGPLFMTALALLVIDALVVFWLAGGLYRLMPRRRAMASALVLGFLAATLIAPHALAQGTPPAQATPPAPPDPAAIDFAKKMTIETRLAYILTGDAEVDNVSKIGLQGLTLFLAQRTALEAGDPVGLDPARDELAFFPLIYWPIVPNAARPSREALTRIDTYMKQGGTVLFDTRDAVMAPPGPGGENRSPGMLALRDILAVARHSGTRAGAARSRADQDVLPAEGLPRPLLVRASSGSRRSRRRTTTSRSARRAAATVCRRSSSRRTISRAPGRSARTGSRSCRWCRASRASASSHSAPASTS